jgi:hypothetical protein
MVVEALQDRLEVIEPDFLFQLLTGLFTYHSRLDAGS